MMSKSYLAVVQSVLLFGSETCVLSERMPLVSYDEKREAVILLPRSIIHSMLLLELYRTYGEVRGTTMEEEASFLMW